MTSFRPRPRILWTVALLGLAASCADVGTVPPPEELVEALPYDDEALTDHWDQSTQDRQPVSKNTTNVRDLINDRACSTGPTRGLSIQVAEEVECMRPGSFESIQDISNIRLGAGALPFLQKNAARALRQAAANNPNSTLQIHSTWRSPIQQHILKSWEGTCGISIAARPGRSHHESGLALDVQNSWPRSLTAVGFRWYCDRFNGGRTAGCRDIPHWDFPNGTDMRSLGVKAFQRLWNRANPNDRISEDGAYGPQTAARMLKSPLDGFAVGTSCGGSVDPQQPQQPDPQEPQEPNQPDPGNEEVVLASLMRDAQGRQPGGGATIWRPEADLPACASWSINENFSSGRFNLHRYHTGLTVDGQLRIRLQRTAGNWQPAIFAVDESGELVYAGDASAGHSRATATTVNAGRSGSVAELTIDVERLPGLHFYVTGWSMVDSGLVGKLPRDARYTFSIAQSCSPVEPDSIYRGLSFQGMEIPRAGLQNDTLRRVHGVSRESFGDVIESNGLHFVQGRVSWFGGPNDTGVTSTETGAITGERLRSLNNPTRPSASTLAQRPEDYYFIAMRWAYGSDGARGWRSRRLLVVNPTTGAAVVVRPVDWGPNIRTRRVMDLSPQVLKDLDISTDDNALIAFVDDNTPLGPVRR